MGSAAKLNLTCAAGAKPHLCCMFWVQVVNMYVLQSSPSLTSPHQMLCATIPILCITASVNSILCCVLD